MKSSLLAGFLALSVTTFAEEWRYWTWTGDARMGAITGSSAWFATSGGAFEWDLEKGTSQLYQLDKGLESTDLVSIATQSDGSVWTVSRDGHLAVKRSNRSFWEPRGTYSAPPSPWRFNQRAMVIHPGPTSDKDILVMGGPQGLTFFPTYGSYALDWTDQFGPMGKREVRSLSLHGDTLWVGLMGAMMRIIPPWDSLGNNQAFISDSRRWTTLIQRADTLPCDAMMPTPQGMNWDTLFTWASATVLLNKSGLFWNGNLVFQTTTPGRFPDGALYPTHAVDLGDALLLSSGNNNDITKGPMVLFKNGTAVYPPLPGNAFPTSNPSRVLLDGSKVIAWSNKEVVQWERTRAGWYSPWDSLFENRVLVVGGSGPNSYNTADDAKPNNFKKDSRGHLWVGVWGQGLWGAFPLGDGTRYRWSQWDGSNSCLTGASGGKDFVAVNALRTDDSTAWGIVYRTDGSDSSLLFQSPSHRGGDVKCWTFQTSPTVYHNDLLLQPDKIWIASRSSLRAVERPRTGQSRLNEIFRKGGDFYRLAALDRGDASLVIAMTPSELIAFDAQTRTDAILASSLQQHQPLTGRQIWTDMAIDGLGQIWASGSEGIDIIRLAWEDSTWAFRKVREVTTHDGLLSNSIYSMDVDPETGIAVMATTAGLAHWTSPYRSTPDRLETKKARVWPNPLRTRSNRELVVDGATRSSHFYLHAADGSLVLHLPPEAQAGGYFRWTVPSTSSLRPGVYRWTLKDGSTKVGGPLLIAE
ncbi:MAG: hypothetical protein H6686_00035 [Fibrobacteria bacterium]|nr:hypothetical protein [Fibrobacteria bacterium]